MSNRIFRLSISPEDIPEVRRVIDFDGRHTLHDVHDLMHRTLDIGDDDHLYAFFLSGRYWDSASEYVDPRTDGKRADKALLFRLGLRAGQQFGYLYDYGDEHRYSITVVSVTEAALPLADPVVVESVGEAPPSPDSRDFEDEDLDANDGDDDELDALDQTDAARAEGPAPELRDPMNLVAALLEQNAAIGKTGDDDQARPRLAKLADSALELLGAIDGNLPLLSRLDRETHSELIDQLLGMPTRLSAAHETELAVRVAEALRFFAPDEMNGEIALAYAEAGDRERALARVLVNLETASEPFVAENQAGDVYRALSEYDAAEAYYRRAMAIAESPADRQEAALRITSLLIETGREADAASFVAQQRADLETAAKSERPGLPAVGRNEPCPCGSGKKYKKCHGA